MNRLIGKGIETLNQYRGWKTSEKLVIFESDDWGLVRTTSHKALEGLREIGVSVDKCHYMRNDSLESKEDFNQLFSVLKKHKDIIGNSPVFTFNTVVTNPNFQEIKKDNFLKYHYSPFYESYNPSTAKEIMESWRIGINEGLIYPQFHGREHVNIGRWLKDLQNGREDTLAAFDFGMFGISGHIVKEKRGTYLAVFDDIDGGDEIIDEFIREGLKIFINTFGLSPKTFIAPNYIWNDSVERSSLINGIIAMQGSATQILPTKFGIKQGVIKNFLGKKSQTGIGYLIRNVVFEPASDRDKDWIKSTLIQINRAFKQKKPAIIDSHRVNYMGTLNSENRERNLRMLDELFLQMLKNWPDIKFIHSEKLAELIYKV
jgi:hypothetical protein